jgi:transposase-like protein
MSLNKDILNRKGQRENPTGSFSIADRRAIVKEYLEGDISYPELGRKYGVDYRRIFDWKKRFGHEFLPEIELIAPPMTIKEQEEFEALKKQNEALRKKLEYEQMRNFALETMADLAKTELGIDIRKNFGAKQPKA